MMKRGQVWIETVVYTLIGLTLIGVVLAFVTPKINEYRDRALIEQTISSLNTIDSKVGEVLQAPGNKRIVEFRMRRGELFIDEPANKIYFTLNNSAVIYSEPGVQTSLGRIKILTTQNQRSNSVVLSLQYSVDLRFRNDDSSIKKFSAAATPYTFSFEHAGFSPSGGEILNIDESSQ